MKTIAAVTVLGALALAGTADAGSLPDGKYYQKTVSKTCTDINLCLVTFPTLPADKALRVESIDCSVGIGGTGKYLIFASASSNLDDFSVPILPAVIAGSSGRSYVVHHDGDFYMSPGAAPRILLGATFGASSVSAVCTYIGRLGIP